MTNNITLEFMDETVEKLNQLSQEVTDEHKQTLKNAIFTIDAIKKILATPEETE